MVFNHRSVYRVVAVNTLVGTFTTAVASMCVLVGEDPYYYYLSTTNTSTIAIIIYYCSYLCFLLLLLTYYYYLAAGWLHHACACMCSHLLLSTYS
jgi:hypothetical protein